MAKKIPEEAKGIIANARKWVLKVLDPDHYIEVAELKSEVETLIAGNAELTKCLEMIMEYLIVELKKDSITINADYLVLSDVDNSFNTDLSHNHLDATEKSTVVLSASASISTIFDDVDELIEQARKKYPKGGHKS